MIIKSYRGQVWSLFFLLYMPPHRQLPSLDTFIIYTGPTLPSDFLVSLNTSFCHCRWQFVIWNPLLMHNVPGHPYHLQPCIANMVRHTTCCHPALFVSKLIPKFILLHHLLIEMTGMTLEFLKCCGGWGQAWDGNIWWKKKKKAIKAGEKRKGWMKKGYEEKNGRLVEWEKLFCSF